MSLYHQELAEQICLGIGLAVPSGFQTWNGLQYPSFILNMIYYPLNVCTYFVQNTQMKIIRITLSTLEMVSKESNCKDGHIFGAVISGIFGSLGPETFSVRFSSNLV